MKSIDEITVDFLAAHSSKNKDELSRQSDIFLREIKRNEWGFQYVTHYYNVARALYYLLEQEEAERLSDREYSSISVLTYYCLLKNYLNNNEAESSDTKYVDLIGGSELAFIVICENIEFFMYSVLTSRLHYMPNYSKKHLRDQLLLFGGIVKESKQKYFHNTSDVYIINRFQGIASELYNQLPVGESLLSFKRGCLSIIQDITDNLEVRFEDNTEEDYSFDIDPFL